MKLHLLVVTVFVALVTGTPAIVDHDKIEPFPQPEPVTVSEKAAIKFKPQLYTHKQLCVPFPAVNAAGEITGGLSGANGNDACKYAPKGAQVYGRAGWYKDLWAIMYSWYFPKGFNWLGYPSRRHDWRNVVVWIDNPELETPKIIGVAMAGSDTKYRREREMYNSNFVGSQVQVTRRDRRYYRSDSPGSSTNLRFENGATHLDFARQDGDYQDLIMWEQLTDAARIALNDNGSFGYSYAEVPFSDEHFEANRDKAWPL
ncbi:hypothetical protein DVH05_026308 [Phytophthora capsici]|nr:hypothetical protein DVH05_026308 [Phytophthora capsici]